MFSILLLTLLSVLLPCQTMPVEDDGKPQQLIQKGTAALRAGKVEEALTLANQAVTIAPREPRTYLLRGSIYPGQRRRREAIAQFDVCRQLDPECADAW